MLNSPVSQLSLLSTPWDAELAELLTDSEEFLLLASPFITRGVTSWIAHCLSKRTSANDLRIVCLTNVRVDSVLSGSLDLDGIAELGKEYPHFSPIHLPSLHAKVFVADSRRAIVTSGNLTEGGLRRNCEYGVSIRDPKTVERVRRDFEDYSTLGVPLSIPQVAALGLDLAGLRATFQVQNRRLLQEAGSKLRNGIRSAEDRVLQFRARSGTTQGIFRKTILYLLARSSLRTSELHPLIQQIHPDLCDDNIDRVIDGMNFGKKWKHHVRSAQQALKREGTVLFEDGRWRLSGR